MLEFKFKHYKIIYHLVKWAQYVNYAYSTCNFNIFYQFKKKKTPLIWCIRMYKIY